MKGGPRMEALLVVGEPENKHFCWNHGGEKHFSRPQLLPQSNYEEEETRRDRKSGTCEKAHWWAQRHFTRLFVWLGGEEVNIGISPFVLIRYFGLWDRGISPTFSAVSGLVLVLLIINHYDVFTPVLYMTLLETKNFQEISVNLDS